MIRIVTILDKAEWVSYVDRSAEIDFYHTWHYHSLDNIGVPFLFVYEEGADFIVMPLIQREIPRSIYFDLTCVYGYSGPLSNKKMDVIDKTLIKKFKDAFLEFLSEGRYVSVFVRMHPFYEQKLILDEIGSVHENGHVVAINLTESIEDQRKQYSRSTLAAVKKTSKKGYYVKEEKGDAAFNIFKEIYEENMKRVGASHSYLFGDRYYSEILNNTEYDARVFMAYQGNVVACTTIAVFTNGIIQSYLIGTRPEYLHDSPAKFLIDEIAQIGREQGMRYFNLGSGLGFQKDSLFDWKKAFSDLLIDYRSWRYIANPIVYQQLLDQKGIDKDTNVDFFPLYRLC